MKKTHFTVILPGLVHAFDLAQKAEEPFVPLSKFLQKAKHTQIAEDDTALKFKLLTGKVPEACPVATMSALADGLQLGPHVMRADPVEFKVGMAHAYMVGYRHLSFSRDELSELSVLLNPLLTEFNLSLSFSEKGRGYLVATQPLQLETTDPDAIIGKSVTEYFPAGVNRNFWLRLMTEIQMQLSESKFNQRRRARGLEAVSGLWFWGQGESLISEGFSPYHTIFSDDEVVLGIADQLNVQAIPSITPVEKIIETASKVGGNYLLASSKCLSALHSDESLGLLQTLFYPLLKAVNARKIASLEVYPGGKHCYDVSTNVLRKWWKLWSRI